MSQTLECGLPKKIPAYGPRLVFEKVSHLCLVQTTDVLISKLKFTMHHSYFRCCLQLTKMNYSLHTVQQKTHSNINTKKISKTNYVALTILAHLSGRLIGELIVYPCSGVRTSSSSTILNIFSETTCPIKAKFYVEPPCVGERKFVCGIWVK